MVKAKLWKETEKEIVGENVIKSIVKRNINICLKEFEIFYELLMKSAPENYSPWLFACKSNTKNPSPTAILKIDSSSKGSWHHDAARLNKEQCIEHIKLGYNIAISARKDDPLILGDIDNPEYLNQLPEDTLTTTTRKRVGAHFFCWDKDGTAKINLPTDDGEIRSDNQYVMIPGSHVMFDMSKKKDIEAFNKLPSNIKNDPFLGYYTIRDSNSPKTISFSELPKFFQDKQKENFEAEIKIKQREETRDYSNSGIYDELFKLKVSDIVGLIPSNEREGHPLHESDTDANFSVSADGTLAHCWRHLVTLNAVQYLCVKSGYATCGDAGTPHKGRGISKIKGDKKALQFAYKEAIKLELIKEKQMPEKKKIIKLPRVGKLMSEFILENSNILKDKNILFYRPDFMDIVEIGKIKIHKTGEEKYNGFISINPNRYITLIEEFVEPGIDEYNPEMKEWIFKKKSMSVNVALVALASKQFKQSLPQIERIFNIPIPIIHEGKLTFPKKGFDERFGSWLPYDSVQITNPDMGIKDAKKILFNIYNEFCFKSHQDYINAIAGLLTPYLRGIFPTFNTRTPLKFTIANRERAGKDYIEGITGIVYEGYALEEPAISSDETGNNNSDELRKKITGAMIRGRKRLHFTNNRGYINNPILEGILTSKKHSDRPLGKSDILEFDNEMDFSLSGNIGVRWTPDLGNRSRFVRLHLSIEDANKRKFNNPDLHGWVLKNRGLIISALYSLVRNWFDNGCPKGSIPFASFPEWASICGGIMETAGYDSPCNADKETLSLSGDVETQDMKKLFEACFKKHPEEWIRKKEMQNIIISSDGELFNYFDMSERSGTTKFGQLITKFIDREQSKIMLICKDQTIRGQRQEFKFTKNMKNESKKDIFGEEGYQVLHTNGNDGNPIHIPRAKIDSKKDRGLENVTNVPKVTKYEQPFISKQKLGKYEFKAKDGKIIKMKPDKMSDEIADLLFDDYDVDDAAMQGKGKLKGGGD